MFGTWNVWWYIYQAPWIPMDSLSSKTAPILAWRTGGSSCSSIGHEFSAESTFGSSAEKKHLCGIELLSRAAMKHTWLFRVYGRLMEIVLTGYLVIMLNKPLRGSLLNNQCSGKYEFFRDSSDNSGFDKNTSLTREACYTWPSKVCVEWCFFSPNCLNDVKQGVVNPRQLFFVCGVSFHDLSCLFIDYVLHVLRYFSNII